MDKVLTFYAKPEEADAAARRAYAAMTADERVALTVALQRAYYESLDDAPRRLSRILEFVERS